jgi:outer membrane murein-binding lipoprotein Lpp
MEKQLKTIVIILASVAVLLAGALAWIWIDRGGVIKELNLEKDDLTLQMVQLRSDYDSLSTTNDTLNMRLMEEREKIDLLIERINKTEATNRVRMREYEKELGTLRSIMRSYIHQIDSLNTLNIALRKDASQAREEASRATRQYQELQSTTEEYARQVELGAQLKGRDFVMTGITEAGKESNRSSRISKLKVCGSLIENAIAPKGPAYIYLRVKGPDGILLTNPDQGVFNAAGEQLVYSAVREIDYQGSEVEFCIFFGGVGFTRGIYTAEIFTSDGKIGTADILLR